MSGGTEATRHGWLRLLGLVPSLLLLAVVALHQFNVRANDLAPERGGGFGMFAFVDAASHRAIHLTLATSDATWTLDLADHLAGLGLTPAEAEAAMTLPTDGTLHELAARVLAASWHRSGDTLSLASDQASTVVPLERVTVTVVGIAFDQDQTALRSTVVKQLEQAA